MSNVKFAVTSNATQVSFEFDSDTSSVGFEPAIVPSANDNVIEEVCVNDSPLPVNNKSVNVDLTNLATAEALQQNTKYVLDKMAQEQDTALTEHEIDLLFN